MDALVVATEALRHPDPEVFAGLAGDDAST
jgi:hypothetical protein